MNWDYEEEKEDFAASKRKKLEDCLKHFSTCEDMFDANSLYDCESCSNEKYGTNSKKRVKSEAIARTLFFQAPRNLIINLKRFGNSGRGWVKNNC